MADQTKIQWCHSTVNPVMGCGGCELFPAPGTILTLLDSELAKHGVWPAGTSRLTFNALADALHGSDPRVGHVSTTNVWHLRRLFIGEVSKSLGPQAANAAHRVIAGSVTCYAAKLHLNRGIAITNPRRKPNKGYAPVFEHLTRFPGRVARMARESDLREVANPDKPWLDGCRRLIFVSDMGDAFSRDSDFGYLNEDVMPHIRSEEGQRHWWLWLTKRPGRMARFGELIGGFPDNVCAMTTITGPSTLGRLDELRRIPANVRGVSAEPLWERIPPTDLDLSNIDWLIVGGESGAREIVRPFDLAWARELRDDCARKEVAFFLKQLGRRPTQNDRELTLHDPHGGDWDEWPEDLRTRQMPAAFYGPRAGLT